jgi:hypothetical protein
MKTPTYSVQRDGRGWVVVEEFGRTRRRAGVFSTLVAALEFVGNEHELRARACLASRPGAPLASGSGLARVA